MSCFNAWFGRLRRAGPLVALMVAALASASCGFQPLYGKPSERALSAQDRLGTVRILPLPDRVGQQMHNLLRDRLNPRGQPARPDYNLQVTVSEALEELGIRTVPAPTSSTARGGGVHCATATAIRVRIAAGSRSP